MSCTLPTASIDDGAAGVRWQPAHKKTQTPRIRIRLPGISVPGKACRYDATRGTSNPRLDADVTDTPVRRCGASYDISERTGVCRAPNLRARARVTAIADVVSRELVATMTHVAAATCAALPIDRRPSTRRARGPRWWRADRRLQRG